MSEPIRVKDDIGKQLDGRRLRVSPWGLSGCLFVFKSEFVVAPNVQEKKTYQQLVLKVGHDQVVPSERYICDPKCICYSCHISLGFLPPFWVKSLGYWTDISLINMWCKGVSASYFTARSLPHLSSCTKSDHSIPLSFHQRSSGGRFPDVI